MSGPGLLEENALRVERGVVDGHPVARLLVPLLATDCGSIGTLMAQRVLSRPVADALVAALQACFPDPHEVSARSVPAEDAA